MTEIEDVSTSPKGTQDERTDDTEVLVVEDEPLLLFEASDCLEEAGFVVHTAMNAHEALRILESHSRIDVLFTDVQMPGRMNGIELAGVVRDRWPDIRVILTSGHVSIDREELAGLDVPFFPKPYLTERVIAEIGRMASGG